MNNQRRRRPGLSLIELLVVVTLLGIFAGAAMTRSGRDVFADTGSRAESRLMSIAMLHAQRAAIRTGDPHGIVFQGPASSVVSWSIFQKRDDNSKVIVEGPHMIYENVDVSVSAAEMWFDFEGNGSQSFLVHLRGPNRAYQIQVEPLTRMIKTQDVSK